jgi:hypothetical protein
MDSKTMRSMILDSLVRQGFALDETEGTLVLDRIENKEKIRSLYVGPRRDKMLSQSKFLKSDLDSLSHFFADGKDLNLKLFAPCIVEVGDNSDASRLFRLATLLWSVPVSQGFGRRLRFLVLDRSNEKLIGIFAIGDPVFNLQIRDQLIGWNHVQRAKALYHMMDIFVLGAVPPYSDLLCGKLVAMLAATNEVREAVFRKYSGSKTNIEGTNKEPHLVMLTTASALGRSSIYNRIKFKNQTLYYRIGQSKGWGHFHLGNGTFPIIRKYLEQINHPIVTRNRFGQGPNWKMRTIRTCLKEIGLSPDLLRHGIQREIYVAPLALNYREFLNGQSPNPHYYDFSHGELVGYFKERWLLPRAERIQRYRYVKHMETLAELRKCIQD